MGTAQGNEAPGEVQQCSVGFGPVDPADLVILAVRVVVALLSVGHFVTSQQHRRTLRQQECGQQVASLAVPQCVDVRVVGGTLHPAVPAAVVAGTVAVFLTVGFVVLVVVGDQIIDGHTIVGGHEIDAGPRLTMRAAEHITGTSDTFSHLAQRARGVAPMIADGVSVTVIPLRPRCRKCAELVAAQTHIPRLSNQLHL